MQDNNQVIVHQKSLPIYNSLPGQTNSNGYCVINEKQLVLIVAFKGFFCTNISNFQIWFKIEKSYAKIYV